VTKVTTGEVMVHYTLARVLTTAQSPASLQHTEPAGGEEA